MGGSSFSPTVAEWTPTLPGDRPLRRSQQHPATHPEARPDGTAVPTAVSEAAVGSATAAAPQLPPASAGQAGGTEPSSASPPAGIQRGPSPPECAGDIVPNGRGSTPAAARQVLCHPRSEWMQRSLPDPHRHFKLLAKVRGINYLAWPRCVFQLPAVHFTTV